MERLERMHESGEIDRLTKKEGLMIDREVKRLQTRLNGIRSMKKLPDLIFVVDVTRELTSIHEANLKQIPVLAMVDTNCNPSGVDYIIPSNDDAIRAIKLLVGKIADAVLEGKAMRKDVEEEIPGEGYGSTPASSTRAGRFGEESELEDKDLLGESTLAKLGGKKPSAEILIAESDDNVVVVDNPEELA
jgi:small subunit ribosomal protein S2